MITGRAISSEAYLQLYAAAGADLAGMAGTGKMKWSS